MVIHIHRSIERVDKTHPVHGITNQQTNKFQFRFLEYPKYLAPVSGRVLTHLPHDFCSNRYDLTLMSLLSNNVIELMVLMMFDDPNRNIYTQIIRQSLHDNKILKCIDTACD